MLTSSIAGLLDHVEAGADVRRQTRERRRHALGEEARALAAAEHHKLDGTAPLGRPIGRCAAAITAERTGLPVSLTFGSSSGRKELRALKRGRDARHALGEHAVGAAEHGVLLVQDRRDAAQPRRFQGRERRIAAEADDRLRFDAPEQRERGAEPARQHQAPSAPSRWASEPASVADGTW